jgi:hypothetical protein
LSKIRRRRGWEGIEGKVNKMEVEVLTETAQRPSLLLLKIDVD